MVNVDDIDDGDNDDDLLTFKSFTLSHFPLQISGRCYDVTSGSPVPPQGLQLVLRVPSAPLAQRPEDEAPPAVTVQGGSVVADTMVMNNLGYFQFQAAPGVRREC